MYSFRNVWRLGKKPTEEDVEKNNKNAIQRKHMRDKGFLIVVSEKDKSIIEEFSEFNPILIYSMWKGYIDKNIGGGAFKPKLAAFCNKYEAIHMHTPGHAYHELIEAVINAVNPREAIIPIHTENASGLLELDIPNELKEKIRICS